MLFKKTKLEPNLIDFRKACVVIDSCKTYSQLKNAMNYANLYYVKNKDYTKMLSEEKQLYQSVISKLN